MKDRCEYCGMRVTRPCNNVEKEICKLRIALEKLYRIIEKIGFKG